MLSEHIVQNNIKIATFLKLKVENGIIYIVPAHEYFAHSTWQCIYRPEALAYHKSWDWLIPVMHELLSHRQLLTIQLDASGMPDLEKTYEAVICSIDYIVQESQYEN